MNTVRSTPHMEFAIASVMTLAARMARAVLAEIRFADASQEPSPPIVFGRWSW